MKHKNQKISVLDHGHIELLESMGDDRLIVQCARESTTGDNKTEAEDKKLLKYLWKNKHTSPFEMVKFRFHLKMPIFVARQYVRHRMQNMNEYSLRYSEARPDFYIPRPNEWRKQASKNVQASDGYFESNAGDYFEGRTSTICNLAYEAYQEMINHGVAREQARIVLPLNLYTTMTVCWDLKNLIHFIALRDDAHAQLEIQVYGKAMKSLISQVVPWVVELYEEKI